MAKKKAKKKSTSKKNLGGRPTTYNQTVLKEAQAYLTEYNSKHNHPFPSHVGLAQVIKRGINTLYEWQRKTDDNDNLVYPEFKDVMDQIKEIQEMELIHNGVRGIYQPTVTSLILGKHGYHKKVDNEHSGPGGGPIETKSKTLQVVGVESEHPDS